MKCISVILCGPAFVAALLCSSFALAIVNPGLGKQTAPIVLTCVADEPSKSQRGEYTDYRFDCTVTEVERKPDDISIAETITIEYSANHAEIDRQTEEMHRHARENPGWAGPAPELPPALPKQGATIVAYLKLWGTDAESLSYGPAAGFMSFETVDVPASEDATDICSVAGEAATNSASKQCEQQLLERANSELQDLFNRIVASADSVSKSGDLDSMRQAAASQSVALRQSQSAWEEYRNETCRFVYYEYYPGSMAELQRLACSREITENRTRQLASVYYNDGQSPPEF
jgi:uncharacterized protein YecT (DUF1311 family)